MNQKAKSLLLYKMETGKIINPSIIQDGFMTKTHDEEELSKSHNDTTKRLKNRERQRRYRARKRREADTKKASVTNQPTPPRVEVELNGHHNNNITPNPCKRNWKKDARRAHAWPSQERETHSKNSVSLWISETDKTKFGRRDWKAEARSNKK